MPLIIFLNSAWIQVAPMIFLQLFSIHLHSLAKHNNSLLWAKDLFRILNLVIGGWQKGLRSLQFQRSTFVVVVCNLERGGIPFILKMEACTQLLLTRDMFHGPWAMRKTNWWKPRHWSAQIISMPVCNSWTLKEIFRTQVSLMLQAPDWPRHKR